MKLSEVYVDGVFYVVGYHTGQGSGEEIELLDKVYIHKKTAIKKAKEECWKFANKELLVFAVPLPTEETYSTLNKSFTLEVIYTTTVTVEAKNTSSAVAEAFSRASKMPREAFKETWKLPEK